MEGGGGYEEYKNHLDKAVRERAKTGYSNRITGCRLNEHYG